MRFILEFGNRALGIDHVSRDWVGLVDSLPSNLQLSMFVVD